MDIIVTGLPSTVVQEEEVVQIEEEPQEEKSPVLPDTAELIWGAVAFFILFAALWKFAFPRIGEMLKARSDKIRGDLEGAEEQRRQAESLLARYEEQLRDARSEAGRIIEEARTTAESMRRDMLAKAEEDSRQIVARAQEEIRAERDRAFEQLRSSVGELSVELASRVIGTSLDKEAHRRMVDDYIDEVATLGNGSGAAG